jgi:hypothetical protein
MIVRKHLTLLNTSSLPLAEGIDQTITIALDTLLTLSRVTDVHLVNATPLMHTNGYCLVTVIADVVIEHEHEQSAGKVYRSKKKE